MKFRNIGRYVVNLDNVVYIDTIVPNKLYLKMNDGINLEFDGTLEEFLLDSKEKEHYTNLKTIYE